MELLPTSRFQESIATKLRDWSLDLAELRRQLSICAPERRHGILAQMQKLGAKRRAAELTLREMRLRRYRLPEEGHRASRDPRALPARDRPRSS